ncbi:unnamed protein product [Oikopleura dioica]|uniref:Schlafen AlbA-2 domain-containing protein n=1 Tax=Oikopleura dioica TaxID=34765 RepID=E4YKH3_OIKDI|nr:unnamed protein product [Oikopleura dioica]CBY42565.1 unnamed protein product [Oikopleura dioica]
MISKINWKRYYRFDTKINEVEDRTHEFKNHWFITQAQIKRGGFRLHPITTVICGFLNQGLGGTIYLGIRDSGQVTGLSLTPNEMDHLSLSVGDALERFNPVVTPGLVTVVFLPILNHQDAYSPKATIIRKREYYEKMRSDSKDDDINPHEINGDSSNCWCGKEAAVMKNNGVAIPSWIVEIKVNKHSGFESDIQDEMSDVPKMKYHLAFEDECGQAFLRHDAVNRRMHPFDISRHINDQTRSHYEAIRDDLKKEIDDELATMDLPNKLKNLCAPEIAGSLRKQLGRPILSDVQRMLS